MSGLKQNRKKKISCSHIVSLVFCVLSIITSLLNVLIVLISNNNRDENIYEREFTRQDLLSAVYNIVCSYTFVTRGDSVNATHHRRTFFILHCWKHYTWDRRNGKNVGVELVIFFDDDDDLYQKDFQRK